MAHAVIGGSQMASLDARKQWIDAKPDRFESSSDPAIAFGRDLLPSLNDLRRRTRILNEKLLRNRSAFARALAALQAMNGTTTYPDANFTLRVTFGHAAGYTSRGKRVPFTTRFGDMFALARSRGNKGDFALPSQLQAWRTSIGDATFKQKYAALPVDPTVTLSLNLPLAEGKILALVHALGKVLHSNVVDSHMQLEAEVPSSIVRKLRLQNFAARGTFGRS